MGFKDRLRRGKKAEQAPSAQPEAASLHQLTPWPRFEKRRELTLPPEGGQRIAVFDSGPLQGHRHGDMIPLEFFLGDAVLTNTLTGAACDTKEMGASCLLYDGAPVGVIHRARDVVAEAHRLGVVLRATAQVGPLPPPGIDAQYELTLQAPGLREIQEVYLDPYRAAAGVPDTAGHVTYIEWDSEDYRLLASRDEWIFPGVVVSQIPEEIAVLAADGAVISRVTPRNMHFKGLAEAASISEMFYVEASRMRADTGSVGYRIDIWHW